MKIKSILRMIRNSDQFILYSSEVETSGFISRLVSISSTINFLEIGTHLGYTSLMVLDENPKVKVTTVDMNLDCKKYLKKVPALQMKNINFVNNKAGDFYRTLDRSSKFGVIYIDADHSFMGIIRDFCNLINYIENGSYIVLHDSHNPDFPGIGFFLRIIRYINMLLGNSVFEIMNISTPSYPIGILRKKSGITILRFTNRYKRRSLFVFLVRIIYTIYYFLVVRLGLLRSLRFSQDDITC